MPGRGIEPAAPASERANSVHFSDPKTSVIVYRKQLPEEIFEQAAPSGFQITHSLGLTNPVKYWTLTTEESRPMGGKIVQQISWHSLPLSLFCTGEEQYIYRWHGQEHHCVRFDLKFSRQWLWGTSSSGIKYFVRTARLRYSAQPVNAM
jgi:hypothetical protein